MLWVYYDIKLDFFEGWERVLKICPVWPHPLGLMMRGE